MLTRFKFQNYRAFPKGEFRIRPITILVGANSVGKTSLLQLPLILKQTAGVGEKPYKAALRIHGREINIGDPQNFFFRQNTEAPFDLEIDFTSEQLYLDLTERFFKDFTDLISNTINYYHYVLSQKSSLPKPTTKFVKDFRLASVKEPYSETELKELLSFLNSTAELIAEVKDNKGASTFSLLHFFSPGRRMMLRPLEGPPTLIASDVERIYRVLVALGQRIHSPEFCFHARISLHQEENSTARFLRVDEIALRQNRKDILRIKFKSGSIEQISSDLIENKIVDHNHRTLERSINSQTTIFKIFQARSSDSSKYYYPEIVRSIFYSAQARVESYFEEQTLGHIGPLRAHPKRFYFLDTAYSGSAEGDLIVETLRENDELRNKVNKWLDRFSININVSQLEEIIYRLSVRSEGNTFDLDITDVGFGISQVLPILVEGFIAPAGKMILIEQPEIHLHPKMQGELADLFIDIANVHASTKSPENQKYLIIETHSEYLLSRLRRRISEKAVAHSDVALYFVERKTGAVGSSIRGSYIRSDGQFEWPEEFFEDDLNDTIAYLQNVAK